MLEKLWDDVVAGPHPETGLEKLRKATTSRPLVIDKDADAGGSYKRAQSMPTTPTTPGTPPSTTPRGGSSSSSNVWRSVFHPGSNLATKSMGANLFDRPQPNSPTVYDWLYSDETRSRHR
ncbi:hypothetical protein C2845_PM01G37000 [Panicum miliaceum]|uniref:Auxin-repressed 12.5 kDa protein n=1 Tax=Panicum miliaceum TaxID=4540 RepID=A0A3L6TLJ1_PANMI|nr:hypothetical protein C2845_PM01G37000 [Panicum miliaceum]